MAHDQIHGTHQINFFDNKGNVSKKTHFLKQMFQLQINLQSLRSNVDTEGAAGLDV
jgi:hypothetical protein